MTVFRAATMRTFFFAFHAGAKELKALVTIIMPTMSALCLVCLYYAYYACTMLTIPVCNHLHWKRFNSLNPQSSNYFHGLLDQQDPKFSKLLDCKLLSHCMYRFVELRTNVITKTQWDSSELSLLSQKFI